ncbi:MAG: DUF4175 family protein, partial [Deltaproteobacteria bacterium]|nr:DUF4175 family protein [Deltaproteobacteria bacterium]
DWARLTAVAAVVVSTLPWFVHRWLVRRRQLDPRAVMNATIVRTEPALGRAALRALQLNEQTASQPERGSAELALAHLSRLLGRAALAPVTSKANAAAWRASVLAVLLACAVLVGVIADPFRVLEGFDVLAARDGVAPVAVRWVELPRLSVEPPAYLALPRRPLRPYFPTTLHAGTSVTVRAVPRFENRRLVLTDGASEVPFHDDGEGAVVARWTIERDVSLTIAARFGDVRIEEPLRLEIHAIADRTPHVRLDGAPATFRLLDHPRIPIHWEATDDHGLREIALVLEAGERTERRELSKPKGGVTVDRGGIDLRADDRFLKRSYLPVEVSVQALDGDPVTGPKWGRSESLIIVPPQIGEREALRYAAFLAARDELTDLLAARIDAGSPPAGQRATYLAEQAAAQQRATDALRQAIHDDFGGLRLSGRFAALVRGQIERLDDALAKAKSGPLAQRHDGLVERTENVLLAVDSAVRALGHRDTRAAAFKLADVATDAADAIALSRDRAERARAGRRLDADLQILRGGGEHLLQLGALGADLGEIVQNGLRRIERARGADDRYHAKLAAEDLAARLRQPVPSFGSAGGAGPGGVESGASPGPSTEDASRAAQQAAGVEEALEQLRQEHAAEMAGVRAALDEAMSPEARSELSEQLQEQAKAVRAAVSELPQQASAPESARAAAAQARSQAESMAGALEQTDLEGAVQQGEQALDSLARAERLGRQGPLGGSDREVADAARDASEQLSRELRKARQALEKVRKQASEQARDRLEKSAKREQELGQRAKQIREDSATSEAPLPGEMLDRLGEAADAMGKAARHLEGARGHEALEQQQEAQRLLEMSQPESERETDQDAAPGEGGDFAKDADIPKKSRDASADAFRKRVTEGLGRKAPPHLREALRRYTEGLLR